MMRRLVHQAKVEVVWEQSRPPSHIMCTPASERIGGLNDQLQQPASKRIGGLNDQLQQPASKRIGGLNDQLQQIVFILHLGGTPITCTLMPVQTMKEH